MCFQASVELYMLAKYLMELTLVDYDMVHYNPSEIAAAALCLSQKVFLQGCWVSLNRWQERRHWVVVAHVVHISGGPWGVLA